MANLSRGGTTGSNRHLAVPCAQTCLDEHRNRSEAGFASLLILLLLLTLMAFGSESYFKANAQNRGARREAQGRQAVYAAEAGLELAKDQLVNNPAWRNGSFQLSTGIVQVTAEAQNGGYWVTASSRTGLAGRQIKVFLQLVAGKWVASNYQELHNSW